MLMLTLTLLLTKAQSLAKRRSIFLSRSLTFFHQIFIFRHRFGNFSLKFLILFFTFLVPITFFLLFLQNDALCGVDDLISNLLHLDAVIVGAVGLDRQVLVWEKVVEEKYTLSSSHPLKYPSHESVSVNVTEATEARNLHETFQCWNIGEKIEWISQQ